MTGEGNISGLPDLTACEREPIHIPGSVQSHGALLALMDPAGPIRYASQNAAALIGYAQTRLTGVLLRDLFPEAAARRLIEQLGSIRQPQPTFIDTLYTASGRHFHLLAHFHDGHHILELEPAESEPPVSLHLLYDLMTTFMERLRPISDPAEAMDLSAREIRRITSFDRVLIYRFDHDWNGHVLAEDGHPDMASYNDLWFPASDIPRQARELYRLNRVRLVVNAGEAPAALLAHTATAGQPLDLTYASLRSLSPVHCEYLRNMGVCSSMSVSILSRERQLWGLITLHHRTPRRVSYQVRAACDFVAQSLSIHLDALEQRQELTERIRVKSLTTGLLAHMAKEERFIDGLRHNGSQLLQLVAASGAAVFFEGTSTLIGETPSEEVIGLLVDQLLVHGREGIFHTERLQEKFPHLDEFRNCPPGVLATSLSEVHRSYVLWFRPEVITTVKWGGDPRKPAEPDARGMRIHPRKSFDAWKETVRGRSRPWLAAEIEAAQDLRSAILTIVLRKAEEMAEMSEELQRSNRELEAFSYSVSHDLRAPFRHIVGYAQLLRESNAGRLDDRDQRYLEKIADSAQFAGTLVDNLLHFSQIGRTALRMRAVDMNLLVEEVRRDAVINLDSRQIEWRIAPMPNVFADPILLRLVWQNLVENALKYTRARDFTHIEIGADLREKETHFFIKDNGVGFDNAYRDKLFGIFQRLHRMEDYEGTGIGLANVRRIIARHGGRTWAEGEIDRGAIFWFSLPNRGELEK
ncbi:MAG: GAF domain-containing protein [Bryobacterales bacterium]|nr:GAF domain-containing protein [Bryobacterales bacterium]